MSYTTMYSVWPGERAEELAEFRNSHGSAPVVWNFMHQKFLGEPFSFWGVTTATGGAFWALYTRRDVPMHLRAVLAMTYDFCYISRANFARAASDIRAFLAEPGANDARRVNHWSAIADALEAAPNCPAVAFCWTSCGEDVWQDVYVESDSERGLAGFHRPMDFSQAWELYEHLASSPWDGGEVQ